MSSSFQHSNRSHSQPVQITQLSILKMFDLKHPNRGESIKVEDGPARKNRHTRFFQFYHFQFLCSYFHHQNLFTFYDNFFLCGFLQIYQTLLHGVARWWQKNAPQFNIIVNDFSSLIFIKFQFSYTCCRWIWMNTIWEDKL